MAFWTLVFYFQLLAVAPPPPTEITVALDGSGDFRSIQAAIESLPDSAAEQRVIVVKPGVYREKIFLEKHHVTLRGMSETTVQIRTAEARDIWRSQHPDDWGAAVLNLRATDIHLENLTVVNEYGFLAPGDTTIFVHEKPKVVRRNGHQFALRAFPPTTRLVVKNCTFRALGGDTVSPWNTADGMYFFQNCTMEGDVDFYCPRGWSWAENCRFVCHNLNAAIWHDGTGNESAKTVLKNCSFTGDSGYALGRYHRDAQFYLLDCQFSADMADRPIYKVKKDTALQWPERIFYHNCHRAGGDFGWHRDNVPDSLAQKITWDWTFEKKWSITP